MIAPENDSFATIIERVDGVFNNRLREALDALHADLRLLEERYQTSDVRNALVAALLMAKVTSR